MMYVEKGLVNYGTEFVLFIGWEDFSKLLKWAKLKDHRENYRAFQRSMKLLNSQNIWKK